MSLIMKRYCLDSFFHIVSVLKLNMYKKLMNKIAFCLVILPKTRLVFCIFKKIELYETVFLAKS